MNYSKPIVSVIIPTYCEEHTIGGCLKSIRNQEFKEGRIESIVVDSHSPDNTRVVAKKFADKVIDLKARGVGRARNIGAKNAEGKILLFVDADTFLEKHFVAEMYQTFNDSRIVCVAGVLKNLERLTPADRLFAIFHYGFLNKLSTVTAYFGFPLFPSVCVGSRKSVFEKVGGFAEDMACAEDVNFSRKMGEIGKCIVNKKAKAYTSVRRITNCGKGEMYSMYFKNYVRVFLLNQKPWISEFPHIKTL
ncbi:glycosyltransferase [Candidatus Bathyarchaeota archaeon]|nr:glycosyltransferase [Candidatus Bathyarchaeota archaeon]